MATAKAKSHPLNGMHTSGIFSDMTIDGPIIGTLVAVVDRAKNLPNRKTIGKQDPYCAARLGKEAKKTTTDIRGGQTPKWDQELRFTVHDSPDYYQLKVSVFNDDKKTDLIGEAWIDLRDIIVSGGGQSDQWHSLNCRGKYAGEIRIEITFYDSRPKPEKPAAKPKPVAADRDASGGGIMGRREMPKRRPLPTDPITGEATPEVGQLQDLQDTGPTPPRTLPKQQLPPQTQPPPTTYIPTQSPLQSVEYNTPPLARQQPAPDHYSPSPLGTPNYSTQQQQQQHQIPPQQQRYDSYADRYDDRDASPKYATPHDRPDLRRRSYNALAEHHDLPQLDDSRYSQPHMTAEDDVPPPPPAHGSRNTSRHNSGNMQELMYRTGSFDTSQQKPTPPTSMRHDVLKNEAHRNSMSAAYPGRPPAFRATETAPAAPGYHGNGNFYGEEDPHHPSPPRHYSYDNGYDGGHNRFMQPTVEDAPDSPSPMMRHGYRQNSASGSQPLPLPQPQMQQPQSQYDDSGYELGQAPAPLNLSGRNSAASGHHSTSPGPLVPHRSRHDSYGGHSAPVSPLHSRDFTVSPAEMTVVSHGASYGREYSDMRSELDDTSLIRTTTGGYGIAPLPPSLVPGVDPALSDEIANRIYEERRHERRYTSQQPQQQQQMVATPPRGRQRSEPPTGYGPESSPYTPESAPYNYPNSGRSLPQQQQALVYANGPPQQVVKPRAISPNVNPQYTPTRPGSRGDMNPSHNIRRKSVSPSPSPMDHGERRLSGVPFGPDSYDALNPGVSALGGSRNVSNVNGRDGLPPDYSDSNSKIKLEDGREVDPSDHLPRETWAPEPEPKGGKRFGGESDSYAVGRPSPSSGPQLSSTGKRPLRIAGRPQSMLPAPTYISGDPQTPPLATNGGSAGRNRLQKKANRMSAQPVSSSPAGSSPLAPLMSHNYQDPPTHHQHPSGSGHYNSPNNAVGSGFTPPRMTRASTWGDYPNENHAPMYGSSPGAPGSSGMGGSGHHHRMRSGGSGGPGSFSSSAGPASAPPVPAKVPLPTMSGALVPHSSAMVRRQYDSSGGAGAEWALMEEMSRIDIGTGRSRRHGGGYNFG